MSTMTLDSVVMQAQTSGGAWHTVRTYSLGYAADSTAYTCWDDLTGLNYACSGEHLLTSVQETPYQIVGGADTAMPSVQPITFTYTGATQNFYAIATEKGFDGNCYQPADVVAVPGRLQRQTDRGGDERGIQDGVRQHLGRA